MVSGLLSQTQRRTRSRPTPLQNTRSWLIDGAAGFARHVSGLREDRHYVRLTHVPPAANFFQAESHNYQKSFSIIVAASPLLEPLLCFFRLRSSLCVRTRAIQFLFISPPRAPPRAAKTPHHPPPTTTSHSPTITTPPRRFAVLIRPPPASSLHTSRHLVISPPFDFN